MEKEHIAKIYNNTIALGFVPPAKMDEFMEAAAAGLAHLRTPFPMEIRGTGFMLTPWLVVTAAHLVDWFQANAIAPENAMICCVTDEGHGRIKHWFFNWARGSQIFRMTRQEVELSKTNRLEYHPETDVAAFTLALNPGQPRPPFTEFLPGAINELGVGDPVYVAGYPLGQRLTDLPGCAAPRLGPVVLRGRVVAINPIGLEWHENAREFLVDITAARSLSGAPVCNDKGQVLGVFTGGLEKEHDVIDSETRKPIEQHVVQIPYNIGRVRPMPWGFINKATENLIASGVLKVPPTPADQSATT